MPKETLVNKTYRIRRDQVAFIQISADNKNYRPTEMLRELLDFAQKYYDRKDLIEKLDKKKK